MSWTNPPQINHEKPEARGLYQFSKEDMHIINDYAEIIVNLVFAIFSLRGSITDKIIDNKGIHYTYETKKEKTVASFTYSEEVPKGYVRIYDKNNQNFTETPIPDLQKLERAYKKFL